MLVLLLDPYSKGIFALILTLLFTFVVIATNTNFMGDIGFSLQNLTALPHNMISNCTDVCLSQSNEFCKERWKTFGSKSASNHPNSPQLQTL